MKIQLETLPHQTKALEAIMKAFPGMDTTSNDPDADYIYANPLIKNRYKDETNIDIKMETGTGKTFVYTNTMYELHQKFGLFKFVIAVPTPSIKEGTRSFITSDYAKQYFNSIPRYERTHIQLNVINAGDFSLRSKGRHNFPAQLSEFIESTRQNTNQIEVLLVNQDMLHSTSMSRDDYDQTLLGGETSPIKAIAATRPVVIIDEPQRFPRDKQYYKDIEKLNPQLIFRFGATFPKIKHGRGKNKVEKTDYYRGKPQFDLNAIESFNQGLVKGIDIYYPDMPKEQANNLYKVKSVKMQELVLSHNKKEYSVSVGENLADIDPGFEGDITYEGGRDKSLSNGLCLAKGMELIPGTFAQTYQYQVIAQALDCHFKAEEENFLRPDSNINAPKIKTLSLFFIDSIASFRGLDNSKGWFLKQFEQLLTEKLKNLISKYNSATDRRKKEYCSFLKATLQSLKSDHQKVYAAYFSVDRNSSDKDIEEQVDDILKNKEKLLGFKDKDGNWVTRRFLFSKWTLREGWDNPNVFTIAKLRTSGSEISKIQEVGRGLRLPVDENGHRLSQDEWTSRLSFLIGYDERDFAQKLVSDINDDTPIRLNHDKLTDEMIALIVKSRKQTTPDFSADNLLNDLGKQGVIDFSRSFKKNVNIDGKSMSGYNALFYLYPELKQQTQVTGGKIRDKNSEVSTTVKLRKENWQQLKNLWLQLVRRQMIKFDSSVNQDAIAVAKKVFNDEYKEHFVLQYRDTVQQTIETKDNIASVDKKPIDKDVIHKPIGYGKFLKILTKQTDLPVNLINNLVIKAMRRLGNNPDYINEETLNNLSDSFNNHFKQQIQNSYHYEPLDFSASTSIYDTKTQEFVDSIPATSIGVYETDSLPDSKDLYNRPPIRYDSVHPELDLLNRNYGPKITVFGKIPRKAIKIPRYDKGTTTPDLIFKIEHNNSKPVYLIVETKAKNMRIDDKTIGIIQEKYFNHLKESGVYYKFATSAQEVRQVINKLENEL